MCENGLIGGLFYNIGRVFYKKNVSENRKKVRATNSSARFLKKSLTNDGYVDIMKATNGGVL